LPRWWTADDSKTIVKAKLRGGANQGLDIHVNNYTRGEFLLGVAVNIE
jgi:hypothetical protein